jgi:hypothetical protein
MANQLPFQVESLIIQIKKEFPNWGAPKIRECMLTRFPDIKTPAKSTVHAVLDRNGLVKHKRANARPKAQGTVLLGAQEPNDQIERHIDIDIQFHRLVLSAAANPALEEMLGQIYQRIHNAMVSRVIPTGPFQALSDHQEILKAIKSRDAAGAYRAATEHVMRIYGKLAARRIEGLKPLATQNEIFNAKSSKA